MRSVCPIVNAGIAIAEAEPSAEMPPVSTDPDDISGELHMRSDAMSVFVESSVGGPCPYPLPHVSHDVQPPKSERAR